MTASNWIIAFLAALIVIGSIFTLRRHVEKLGAALTLSNIRTAALAVIVLAPITTFLSLLVQQQAHTTFSSVGLTLFIAALLVLAWIDAETMILPDAFTIPLIWAGLLVNINNALVMLPEAVLGAVIGYLLPWLTMKGYQFVTGTDGLGMGDIKLFSAVGAWLGWMMLPGIILLAIGLHFAFIILISFISKSKWQEQLTKAFPFGPAIAVAGIVAATLNWPLLI